MKTSIISIFSAVALVTAAAHGATLSIADAVSSANGSVINIDNTGGLDWSIWKKPGTTDASLGVATNTKASSSAISDLFIVGAANSEFRASTSSTPDWDFTYTGGVNAPASSTLTDVNGVFHPVLRTVGNGVGLTVTLPTTGTYQITLYVAGYDTTSQLRATLPGLADPVLNNSFAPGFPVSSVKRMGIFTIEATADTAGDLLNLQLTNTSDSNENAHVMITAAAVQLIPEPSAMALAALAGGLALARRRRLH